MSPAQLAERRIVQVAFKIARERCAGEPPTAQQIADVLGELVKDPTHVPSLETIRDHAIAADLWTLERAEDAGDEPTRKLPAAKP